MRCILTAIGALTSVCPLSTAVIDFCRSFCMGTAAGLYEHQNADRKPLTSALNQNRMMQVIFVGREEQ